MTMSALHSRLKRLERTRAAALEEALRAELARLGLAGPETEDVVRDLLVLDERDFRLRYVIDTHIHADHVSGGRRLAAAQRAELCLHKAARVTYPFRPLSD